MKMTHCLAVCTMAGVMSQGAWAQAQPQARVLSAVPVYQQVAVPQQYCEDIPARTTGQASGAGALVGALIGGVAGNALGHGGRYGPRGHYYGSTRGASTIVGALAGGMIGSSIEAASTTPSYTTVRRCTDQLAYEQRATAYDVTYEYAGQRYTTRMQQHPGDWVTVNVQATGTATTRPPTQFYGPNGVYQSAPADMTITDSYRSSTPYTPYTPYTAPTSTLVVAPPPSTVVYVGAHARPYTPFPPPPPHHWR